MADNIVTKSAVSVTEMARMVGLSRARFYQLVRRGTFPSADQDAVTGRPCYFEEKQRQVLEVRRRNCGVDGTPILFYSRRRDLGQVKAPP
jgi:transposase